MADNVSISAGTGTTVATDDVGGVQFQRVKVTWGVDGVAGDVSAANPLPVSLAAVPLPSDAATQTTLAAVLAKIIAAPSTEAKQDAIIAALVTLAGLVDGLEAALAAATPAGSNIIGRVGFDQTTPGTTNGVQERGYQGVEVLTVGAADATPRRSLGINCTVAGNVVLKLADDSNYTAPVGVGLNVLPFAVKGVVTSGTTATATYANLI